jgi:hypothetical protein
LRVVEVDFVAHLRAVVAGTMQPAHVRSRRCRPGS